MKSQKNRQSAIEYPFEHRPIVKSPNRTILFLLLLLSTSLYAQNEANIWYFGESIGLDFNSGVPVPTYEITCDSDANSVMCDSNGNFLFYSESTTILNRNNQAMPNGDTIIGDARAMMGTLILQKPGSDHLYYVFTVDYDDQWGDDGMHYSIVDMNLDGGLGDVTAEKDIPLDMAWAAKNKLTSVRHANGEDIWIVTRNFKMNQWYAAFLLTASGLSTEAILSPVPARNDSYNCDEGTMKISLDKKYLVAAYNRCNCIEELKQSLDICTFNAQTGQINLLYTLSKNTHNVEEFAPYAVEFSPDSKLLYITFYNNNINTLELYQYDVQYIEDSIQFKQSEIYIDSGMVNGLQLARDGKIYCSGERGEFYKYVSVINEPWKRGPACNYQADAIYFDGRRNNRSFPNMLSDYLYRFEWEGEQCQGYPIYFKPNFIPTPDSIVWNFDDQLAPGSLSNELSPTYAFQHPGVHEVKVGVWYPTGRYEYTSREIEIIPSPQPDLGPDTLICDGASIILNANCQADFFSWSTGQFAVSSITVSDSGTYWVRGRFNDTGCAGFDTIHVGFHPPTIIDETNLIITPTTCNGTSGSITGLTALGPTPFAYQWLDLSGNDYGTNIDATNLPAGQYQLTITDGNGCETVSDVYTIEDAGDLQVTQAQTTRPHCFKDDGQIVVHAFSPSGSILEYSIDAGVNYQSDSIFSNLFASGYAVQVRDENGCSGFYLDNPVLLEDIPGPQVQPPVVIDETDFLGNGSVEITATGSTTTLYYSNDNGNTYQSNNGTFNNLTAGTFICIVKDENDCDTAFIVELQNIIMTYLHAVTGEEGLCEDSAALIPVYVDNFNSVANFHLKLGYNDDNLQCEGFINVHPQLLDSLTGWVDHAAGAIHLTWQGAISVSFNQQEKVADLVFTAVNPGQGDLLWYTQPSVSYFTNAGGNLIPAEFQAGEVEIYAPPVIVNTTLEETACLGQMVSLTRFADGNQPPFEYLWTYPDGHQEDADPFFFAVTEADAGQYILVVTDHVRCSDQQVIQLIVSENPVAAFHGSDTLEMHAGDVLDAGPGQASYRWSPGDTTQSIVIHDEGMYLVEMESLLGCVGIDSVYVKLLSEEIPEFDVYIPNAFTPNGDGINDTFKISSNSLNIKHSTLSIYDRWGGLVDEIDGIVYGWDGKKKGNPCPGGVYVYKIVFLIDGIPGNHERVGTVMLVR